MLNMSQKLNLLAWLLAAVSLAANAQTNVIRVSTANSSLTLLVGHDGRLYQLGYGRSTPDVPAPSKDPARETEFHPQFGDGFVLEPALQATHGDGNTSTDLKYVRHASTALDDDTTLTRIELKDKFYPFFVTLCLKACSDEDVIEQWTEIRHDEGWSGDAVAFRLIGANFSGGGLLADASPRRLGRRSAHDRRAPDLRPQSAGFQAGRARQQVSHSFLHPFP